MLSEDACEGDWIALEGMGAYTGASQTHFNGFYSDLKVEIIADAPATSPWAQLEGYEIGSEGRGWGLFYLPAPDPHLRLPLPSPLHRNVIMKYASFK